MIGNTITNQTNVHYDYETILIVYKTYLLTKNNKFDNVILPFPKAIIHYKLK